MTTEDHDRSSNGGAAADLFAVARLLGAHGLRGEVRAHWLGPDVIDPADILLESRLQLRREASPLSSVQVQSTRVHGAELLLRIEGYSDRTQADALRGGELCLPRAELPTLPDGWFWEAELEGAEVTDARLGPIGAVAGLEMLGGRWLLKVKKTEGAMLSIPWAKGLIPEVDLKNRRIRVDLPLDFPGLE